MKYESNKRKRYLSTQHLIQSSSKSMSQLSIFQGESKKNEELNTRNKTIER
jgi:hypothetical protein